MRLEQTGATPSQLDRFQTLARRLSSVGEQVNVTVNGAVIFGGGFRIDNATQTPLYDGTQPRTQLLFVPRNEATGLTTHVLELKQTNYTSINERRSHRSTREMSLRYTERGILRPWGRRIIEDIPAQKPFVPVDEELAMKTLYPEMGRSIGIYLGNMETFAREGDNAALVMRRAPLFVPLFSMLEVA